MKEEHEYLVPDYYPAFACKMGACRRACCEGWPISFTMTDYFKLLSVDCSAELRRRIDGAMHIADHPSPEAYAQISPRYDGQCPMRLEDGRCGMQAELGEEALSAVCRLYPRGVRQAERECSCANSCEAVLELLLDRKEPIAFVRRPLVFDLPQPPERRFAFETMGRAQEIRLWLIAQVQNRAYPLSQRLLVLGGAMQAMEAALNARDAQRVERLLSGKEQTAVPQAIEAGRDQLLFGLDVAGRMLAIMDARSQSIRDYGEAALRYFGEGEVEFARYATANVYFSALCPQWETWFEHMLVNHMFFTQFPFQDRPVALRDEYFALCAVYILLRFVCVGWMAGRENGDELVDVAAAAFRLIDHTEFDRYAGPILRSLGCDDWTHLRKVLCL